MCSYRWISLIINTEYSASLLMLLPLLLFLLPESCDSIFPTLYFPACSSIIASIINLNGSKPWLFLLLSFKTKIFFYLSNILSTSNSTSNQLPYTFISWKHTFINSHYRTLIHFSWLLFKSFYICRSQKNTVFWLTLKYLRAIELPIAFSYWLFEFYADPVTSRLSFDFTNVLYDTDLSFVSERK